MTPPSPRGRARHRVLSCSLGFTSAWLAGIGSVEVGCLSLFAAEGLSVEDLVDAIVGVVGDGERRASGCI